MGYVDTAGTRFLVAGLAGQRHRDAAHVDAIAAQAAPRENNQPAAAANRPPPTLHPLCRRPSRFVADSALQEPRCELSVPQQTALSRSSSAPIPPFLFRPQQSSLTERDQRFESHLLQQTVRLSLDFSFLYRKAGSCRGVRGPDQAARLAETVGRVNITPTAGNVSAGHFSSTAVPARTVSSTVVPLVRQARSG